MKKNTHIVAAKIFIKFLTNQ